ncbi:MAG: hypothetical protein JRD89_10890 [Deltaproteobacteria bacterium]|nr:hypothetical protein [Deltaproteobacteria bacterium]
MQVLGQEVPEAPREKILYLSVDYVRSAWEEKNRVLSFDRAEYVRGALRQFFEIDKWYTGWYFCDVGEWIGEKIHDGVDWIGEKVGGAAVWTVEQIRNVLRWAWDNIFEPGIKTLLKTFTWLWDHLKEIVETIVECVVNGVKWIWEKTSHVANTIWFWLRSVGKPIWDSIRSSVSAIWDWIKGPAMQIWESIRGAVMTGWDLIRGVGDTVKSGVSQLAGQVWEGVQRTGSMVLGYLGKVGEYLGGVAEYVISGLKSIGEWIWTAFATGIGTIAEAGLGLIHIIGRELAAKSVDPKIFRTEFVREEWKKIAPKIAHSPEGVVEWLDAIFAPFIGKALPEVVFESAGLPVEYLPEGAKGIMELMNMSADVFVICNYIDTITALFPIIAPTNLIGWWQNIINVSGINLVAGYGLGTALGAAITPGIRYAYNYHMLPERPPLSVVFDAFSRFKISREALYEEMRYAGINPDTELPSPQRWYTRESLLAHPLEPDKWEEMTISTWGDMYEQIAYSPVRYFELNAAARSGFYDRELFQRALADSSYGPLAMAIVLMGVERSFIRRHLTKFEDELNDAFLRGEISWDDYRAGLRELYGSEDMADVIANFFKDRKLIARKRATYTIIKNLYLAGRLDWEGAKAELIKLGYVIEDLPLIKEQWDMEASETRQLTPSQVLRLYQIGYFTYEQCIKRLVGMGYSEEDAIALTHLYPPKEES